MFVIVILKRNSVQDVKWSIVRSLMYKNVCNGMYVPNFRLREEYRILRINIVIKIYSLFKVYN